ncbi:hypothetical protein QBC35DRAFT_513961 [Podospora australis]|uniref:Uncharacterized protein n=1 Tax=Podospora australis TaxID=1536484 RepID=A0AAN6WXL0_9PEZI|nr:hypothetical protein QBC35DRAFT_513961 [Podospora australis]
MASTASALSLNNFQVVTSSAIPISCILAYNSQIQGCRHTDFKRGSQCSAACVNGLVKVQSTLQDVCGDIRVDIASVLAQALQGNLVQLLCPASATSPGIITTTTTSRASSRAPATTTLSTVSRSTATRVPSLTFTTVRPPTSSASTSTEEAGETETESVASSTTATVDRGFSSTPLPTFEQSAPASTTEQAAPTTSTDTNVPAPTQGTDDDGDRTAVGLPGSGGGSPFDAFAQSIPSSQPRQFVSRGLAAVIAALGISLLLLR